MADRRGPALKVSKLNNMYIIRDEELNVSRGSDTRYLNATRDCWRILVDMWIVTEMIKKNRHVLSKQY